MNQYFFKMTPQERSNILDQHKELYDGFVTRYRTQQNEQPLYIQDYANDKQGVTVSNKGVVKPYTNMSINESNLPLDMIGDGDDDLENGTVDLNDYISLGKYDELEEDYEFDIDEMDDYKSEPLNEFDIEEGFDDFDIKDERDGIDFSIDEFPRKNRFKINKDPFGDEKLLGYKKPNNKDTEFDFDFAEIDEEDIPSFVENINESLDMFRRLKKYN